MLVTAGTDAAAGMDEEEAGCLGHRDGALFPLQLDCLKPLREQLDVLLQPELVRTDGKAAGRLLTQRPAQVSTVTQIVLIV